MDGTRRAYAEEKQALSEDQLKEECDADLLGAMMQDPTILQEIARELERRKAGMGAQLIQSFLETVDRILATLSRLVQKTPLAATLYADYTRKRAQVASLLADFSERYREAQPGEEVADEEARYSIVTDPATLKELESGETIKVYRAAQVIDGKLYPPMAAKVGGQLVKPIELGRWEQADERPELVGADGKFKLDKANGSAIGAAYNPYIHTSRSPLNDQFSSAYKRPNLVTLEVEVPASELTSGYHAQGAKDAVGEIQWHSGPVSSKLTGEKARRVILSRYDKPVRIVPDSEVADRIAGMLEGEDIAVPENVVTPSLRRELEKRGVEISASKGVRFSINNTLQQDISLGYNLANAVPSKAGYEVTRVNETCGSDLNAAQGVVCEQINQVFDPKDAPKTGFGKWISIKVQEAMNRLGLIGRSINTPALGGDVVISPATARALGNHGGPDVKYNIIPAIPEMLQNAVLVQTEAFANSKGNTIDAASHLLAAKVRYDGKRYIAAMVIHESNGIKYYDHSIILIEKTELTGQGDVPAGAPTTSGSASVLKIVQNALLSSGFDKFSDANTRFSIGNVWHGTSADFDAPSLHYVGTGEGTQIWT